MMATLEMQAGLALDTEVHETVMGQSTTPPREYAMAKVAESYVGVTGPEFGLYGVNEDGTTLYLPMPQGQTLPQPEGSDYWNDRYFLFVANFLKGRLGSAFTDKVDAYRTKAPAYSTDPYRMMEVIGRMRTLGYRFDADAGDVGPVEAGFWRNGARWWQEADTLPHAVALAALRALEAKCA